MGLSISILFGINLLPPAQVRPLLPKEKLAGEQVCVRLVPNSMQVVLGKDRAFTFDFAFSAKVTQVCFSWLQLVAKNRDVIM